MKSSGARHTLLSLASGIFLTLPWFINGTAIIIFAAFVPLLVVASEIADLKKTGGGIKFTFYAFVSTFVWNAGALWWLSNASLIAAVAVIVVYTVLMTGVFVWLFRVYNQFGRNTALLLFVPTWICFEYLMMQTQISRPWLNLGNAFANNTTLIQWYEYTGVFGGSVWSLVINVLVFIVYDESRRSFSVVKQRSNIFLLILLIFLPVLISVFRYQTYEEKYDPVRVAVLQPNINSYTEKYSMPMRDQLRIITELADSSKSFLPDYFIAPETSIPIGIREELISSHFTVEIIRDFLKSCPDAEFVIGATTRVVYPNGDGKSKISQPLGNSGDYYDLFNSALQIDTGLNVDIYHKSKLVSGVEFLPYPRIFGLIEDIIPDFGGLSGNHGTQEYREVFVHNNKDFKAGVPICYESVYGDCVAEFVEQGAEILLIITNDGWWGDTQGHRQHNSLSSLRAIETRRSVARSANTGISCLINQRGDVLSYLSYDEKGIITGEINANDKLTFYVKHGDFVARIFTAIGLILNLILVGSILRKRYSK